MMMDASDLLYLLFAAGVALLSIQKEAMRGGRLVSLVRHVPGDGW
jgi:hypothetical protein